MALRRMAAALFAGLLTFQLILAGVGSACPMWDHVSLAGADPDTNEAGAGMAMEGMPMPMSAAGADSAPGGDDAPCDHEAAQRCLAMTSCASGFVTPVLALAAMPARVHLTVLAALVDAPRSATSQPEPPPPRA